jgi:hypothetical protein
MTLVISLLNFVNLRSCQLNHLPLVITTCIDYPQMYRVFV